MNSNSDFATWQFDFSKTKLSPKFMAGRGQVLLQALNWPLQAQEFAKRKKLQEILSKGMLRLDKSKTPLNFIYEGPKALESQQVKSPTSNLSDVYVSEPSPRQQESQNISTMSVTAAPSFETWNYKQASNQFSDANIGDFNVTKQSSNDNPQSEWYNAESNFLPKDFEKKNAAKPLRKPDKARKKQIVVDKGTTEIQNKEQYQGYGMSNQTNKTAGNAWLDWENNVIIPGSVADEDLPEMAAVEDNDDINDVIVDQYINALQHNHHNDTTSVDANRKLTPQKVQQFSKLKSTSNADCTRVLPGTQPNPPKGDDRWGGSELNSNIGWGDPNNTNRNSYDDGSSLWSAGGSQYGGMSWSNAC